MMYGDEHKTGRFVNNGELVKTKFGFRSEFTDLRTNTKCYGAPPTSLDDPFDVRLAVGVVGNEKVRGCNSCRNQLRAGCGCLVLAICAIGAGIILVFPR